MLLYYVLYPNIYNFYKINYGFKITPKYKTCLKKKKFRSNAADYTKVQFSPRFALLPSCGFF